MWLFQRIVYLSIILVAALAGSLTLKNQGKAFRMLLLLMWITLAFESMAVCMAYHHRNNTMLYHVFNPIECILWGIVYYRLLGVPLYKTIIVLLCAATTLFMIVNSLQIQHFQNKVNFYSVTAESGFLLFAALLYFKAMLEHPAEGNILRDSSFWLNCAVLFFYTINILFWISYGYLRDHSKVLLNAFFQLDIYSNYVLYLTIGYAILLENRRPKAAIIA